MLPELPDHVHRKRSKGREYLYFDTGQRDSAGKDVRVRLPDYGTTAFYRDYARLKAKREEREAVSTALTVPALCQAFRISPRFKAKAKNTRDSYETYLRVIEDQFDTFLAADVEPRDVTALLTKMADRPGAANQCIRTLSALYSWGKKPAIGLVSHNPAEGAELYEGGEHEPWPAALLEEALKADDDLVRLAVNLLYYGGQRIGDTCAMPWRKVLGDYDHMAVKQEKTGEELEIRVHADLRAVLRTVPRSLGTIIAKPDGSRYHTSTVRERLKAWAAERGIKAVPHGLRKNAVNALLEAGCSAAQVSAITGQSLQMVEKYARRRDRKKLSGSAVLKWEQNR